MTYPSQPTPPGPGESGLPPSQPWPGNSALPPSVTTMPPPYPPTSGALLPPPPPPGAAQRNPRTFLAVSAVVVLAFITFFTMPGAVAGGVRSAYPTVHAVISGVNNNATVREGQSVTLSGAQSTGNNLTYFWEFGDGTTATGMTVTKSFTTAAQSLNISLNASDPLSGQAVHGHEDSASITISVLPQPPTASFTDTIGATDANGVNVNFDASSSTGEQIQSYQWNFGDGMTDQSSTPLDSHEYTTLGSFSVTVTVIDDAQQTASTTQTVNVTSSGPVARFTANVDSSGSLSVDASTSGGDLTDYFWDFGDGNTDDSGSNPTDSHLYSTNGTYTITLTVTDAFGRKSQTQQSVSF